MICTKFEQLSHREKIEMIGKLVHAVQSDNQLFIVGRAIIKEAEEKGLLDDVVINPMIKNSGFESNPINDLP